MVAPEGILLSNGGTRQAMMTMLKTDIKHTYMLACIYLPTASDLGFHRADACEHQS